MAIKNGAFKVKNISTGEIDEVMLKTTLAQVDGLNKLTGATANTAGVWGLAPAPAKGSQNLPLCGDAKYKVLPVAGGGTGADKASDALVNLGITKELDTKFNYCSATPIENADLNKITTQGVYYVTKGANSSGWDGIAGNNGILEVFGNGGPGFKQRFSRWGTSGATDHMVFMRLVYPNDTSNPPWKRIDNGGLDAVLSNTGYYLTADGLIFAWARIGSGGSNPAKVTKPYPAGFTTLIAQACDSGTGNNDKYNQKWIYDSTTNTTDTFYRADGNDAFTVFWIGKV